MAHALHVETKDSTQDEGESLQIPVTVNGIHCDRSVLQGQPQHELHAVVDTGEQTTVVYEDLYEQFAEKDKTGLKKTYLPNAGIGEGMDAKYGLNVTFKILSKAINLIITFSTLLLWD